MIPHQQFLDPSLRPSQRNQAKQLLNQALYMNFHKNKHTDKKEIKYSVQVCIISQCVYPRAACTAFDFWSDAASAGRKSDCPYNMTVQNVYNINNHGTMYFPGAAQGTQCGDYNSMYMSLQNAERNVGGEADGNEYNSAGYEHIRVL